MTTVSEPRGQSFEEARMTLEDVEAALEKGTVIFNSAGAHIPKLACATLAAVDATSLPNALNMYVTAPGKRTSAPPHTDKQDVVVVQTSGSKHWKVYSPPEPSMKPSADMVRLSVFLTCLVSYVTYMSPRSSLLVERATTTYLFMP